MTEQTLFGEEPEEQSARPGAEPEPAASILVHFATPEDREAFQQLIGQRIPRTGFGQPQLWYPAPPPASWGGGLE